MVQREVGERFAAAPGTSAYGVPSVLAQLACDVRVLRAVPRTVFRPVPNVDSVLLGLRRRGPGPSRLRALVHGAFGHRRKTLAGSLALSGPLPLPDGSAPAGSELRDRARAALAALGHPPTHAPSGWLPRSSASCSPGCDDVDPHRARPRSTSACCWAGRAPTAATSWSPCSSPSG